MLFPFCMPAPEASKTNTFYFLFLSCLLPRVKTQLDLQVASPHSLSWGRRASSSSPPGPEHSSSPSLGSKLLLQPRGGREGEEYRLVCSEDFEQHVLRFLLHQAAADLEGGEGGGGAGGRNGNGASSGSPAFRIYSPCKV